MDRLIIAEKPSVALRIAASLSGGNAKRLSGKEGVGYYAIESKEGRTFVVAAVGHLFTIRQASGPRGYPVLDVEWAPTYQVNKASDYTKKYLDTIMEIAPSCRDVRSKGGYGYTVSSLASTFFTVPSWTGSL